MSSRNEAQPDPEATPVPSDAIAPIDRWIPTRSRLGWPGRLVKRIVRRSLRFAFAPQAELNDRLVTETSSTADALEVETHERIGSILELEGRMLSRVEALESTLTQLAGDASREISALGTRLESCEDRELQAVLEGQKGRRDLADQILREQECRVVELASLLGRLEAIEEHTTTFQSDVTRDFSDVRVTAATQGRQLDDVTGQLVALSHGFRELREEIQSRPELREAILADLGERLAGVRNEITEATDALSDELSTLDQRQRNALEDTQAELGQLRDDWLESSSSIREAIQGVRDAIRDEEETRERDLHAIEAGSLEREAELAAATRHVESKAEAGVRRMESSLKDLRESIRHEQQRLVSRIEGLDGRITEEGAARSALSSMLESIESTLETVGSTLETVEQRSLDSASFAENRARELAGSLEGRLHRLERRVLPPDRIGHYDFSQAFRGETSDIAARFEPYLDYFSGLEHVLDLGCGRGEFLNLCRDRGIGAVGIDSDPDMIGHCRLQGLEVVQSDLLEHLHSLPAGAIDGVFCAQVVEHLSPGEILEVLEAAASALRRGAPLVIETINPGTWTAMRWYFLDPTHCQPVPPGMIRYLLERVGFTIRDIVYGPPLADDERLRLPDLKASQQKDAKTKSLVEILEWNGTLLNDTLFGSQDYAIVAER